MRRRPDGDIAIYRWPGGRSLLAANREPVRFEDALVESAELPHGRGSDRAEALCDLPPELAGPTPRWMVLYDTPGPGRIEGETTVFGDLISHD